MDLRSGAGWVVPTPDVCLAALWDQHVWGWRKWEGAGGPSDAGPAGVLGAGTAPQRCSQWGGCGTRPFDVPGGMWMAQQGGDSRELAAFRDEPRSS